MRVLILSDIHANDAAFSAVLENAAPYDEIWCLGDIVGYGGSPNECINKIRCLPHTTCILGNHDAAAIGIIDVDTFNKDARKSALWTRQALTEENVDFLKTLKQKEVLQEIIIAHGSPRNPLWEYLLDFPSVGANLAFFDERFCFVGHTHLPYIYLYSSDDQKIIRRIPKVGEKICFSEKVIANPGSVGQPRDGNPQAAYAIFDVEEETWTSYRVNYPIQEAQRIIVESNLPKSHALRLLNGW